MNPLGILAAIVALGKARKPTTAPWAGKKAAPAKAQAARAKATPAVVTKKAAPAKAKAKARTQPIPWPAGNAPAFNSRDWEPDLPLRPEVTARALQLIPTLHKRGVGAVTVEFTKGRWIAYVARIHGTKRAVEAFRQRKQIARPPSPAPKPAPVVQANHVETPRAAAQSPSVALPPTIREGSRGEDVAQAQRLLGVKADGIFGPITKAAVHEYQARNGLLIDGIVGPQTWSHLLGAEA